MDAKELKHFKKFSEMWWDEFGQLRILHAMNQLRVPFVRDGLINTGRIATQLQHTLLPLKDITILEVGCGGGILSEALARIGGYVTAIDISTDMIKVAKEHASLVPTLSNLTYYAESVKDHALAHAESYDVVIASEVLEHVNEQELFLQTCVKCLKHGGSIFITTLNKTTMSWLGAIIAGEYIFNFIARGTHEWRKFIAPEEVQSILENCGCKTKLIRGQVYNFFNQKMVLEQKYFNFLCFACCEGLILVTWLLYFSFPFVTPPKNELINN